MILPEGVSLVGEVFHSVTLDVEKCKGCTNCIKGCPTEAIRVRDGKAHIIENKCIDCGECIRICPNNAKYAVTDKMAKMSEYKYNIALPAPGFYGQFSEETTVRGILGALQQVGFNDVFEVALAAEEVSIALGEYIRRNQGIKPLISSSCPAVLRLIQVRFPELIKNIVPLHPPIEIAARRAKSIACERLGIDKKDIGVFFISPCPAKATWVKQPIGIKAAAIDGVFSIADIYGACVKKLGSRDFDTIFEHSSGIGIGWGRSGGENVAIGGGNHLAVDGIHDCIEMLEEVEMDKLSDIDYIECQACRGGCIGGALTVENQFIARVRIRRLAEKIGLQSSLDSEEILRQYYKGYYDFESEILPKPSLALDGDITKAMQKLELLEETVKRLPGLDCGSCGSPNCRSLAEDIVQGIATETDCVFNLRDRVKHLATEMLDLSKKLPPTMDKKQEGGESG